MTRWRKRWAGLLFAAVAGSAGLLMCVDSIEHVSERQGLKNDNLTGLRSEALDLFPRGSRLDLAQDHLARIGFACEPIPHPLPDISGPSLRCASNGRGYPDYPAVNVILLTRNGLVSDVDVWNVIARADSESDDVDFTATGASDALPAALRRPDVARPPDSASAIEAPDL